MAYGVDFSRYREPKRAAVDPDLGPLVGTKMTRCISCTRCVRFLTEVAGVPEMGQTGRGEDSEITSYLGQMLTSELQGNVIDLCPVGALTSKPYAFTARPWELTKTESIDAMDALGSNIRIDSKGREVMRILPRNHDGINEEWLADRSRVVWDGLRRQRLDRPYLRRDGRLQPVAWGEAFAAIATALDGKKLAALAGDLASAEAIYALRELTRRLDGVTECRTDGAALPAGNRSGYVGTATIEDIDTAEMLFLIGTNPRVEAPVLNARIRKAWLSGARVARLGPPADLTYDVIELGADLSVLRSIAAMDHSEKRGRPGVIILGQGALQGADGAGVLATTMAMAEAAGSKLMILHTAASRVGAMDLGFTVAGGMDAALDGAGVVFALGVDEVDIPAGPFVVYQGSHGDRGAHRADVILPGAAYTEESAIFVNTEGRPQMSARAGFPPGGAKENWAILRALSAELGHTLPFDSLAALRRALVAEVPHLGKLGLVPENPWQPAPAAPYGDGPLAPVAIPHFQSNPIARASTILADVARAVGTPVEKVAAE